MLKVLLVDDEPLILQGLTTLIDWNEAGFEIAGKAANGLEALELLKAQKADLIITDIRMPGMTGLELMEKVRCEKLSQAYFAVLSGYGDFECARRAMKNGCVDYMLKPAEQTELLDMLHRVREACERNESKMGGVNNSVRNLSGQLIDRQYIDKLIRAVKANDKEMMRDRYALFIAEMEKVGTDTDMAKMAANNLMFEIMQLALEMDKTVELQELLQFVNGITYEQMIKEEAMLRIMSEFGDYLMELRSHRGGEILYRIEEDIRQNFRENLTLKDMGRKYYINAAYLGQIFKKQYGESFKDFLNRIRVEEAEKLLLYTNKKIYEIAKDIGYKDMDYFISKFISLKGCSPTKFRRQER